MFLCLHVKHIVKIWKMLLYDFVTLSVTRATYFHVKYLLHLATGVHFVSVNNFLTLMLGIYIIICSNGSNVTSDC